MKSVVEETPLHLYDPRNGDLALKLEHFQVAPGDWELPRSNCFTIYWIQLGRGDFHADFGCYSFEPNSLLFRVPYQFARLHAAEHLRGILLQFHANFFCIETHHEEVGCNGILFNDVYGLPFITLGPLSVVEFARLFDLMSGELRDAALAHSEVLVSYLKILLIQSTRLKLGQQQLSQLPGSRVPGMLRQLQELVETHFRQQRSPSKYAEFLAISPKALARLVKTHLHKTLTELIRERILKQAKWELLHTRKPVKEIALELGFEDIFYFSRMFKRGTGCSPTFFRDFETEIRGGRNLSMS
ncbi:helix-turn-helix domain-containing protein, partial [Bryobacter aggregatus]|uniref:helix-turn-helix domain-containing protein n=1 Tax=Bryobacter aggregatus TaxID=360054 RepID=UPI0004E0D8F6